MATPKCAANYAPLTPILFLERSASVYPERTSIIYGDLRFTWKQTMERCRCLASKVAQLVSAGQTVSVLSPNSPAVYELNFGVPMARAVLNSINSRLDARMISVLLSHSETKVLFADSQHLQVVQQALRMWLSSSDAPAEKPQIIVIEDRLDAGSYNFQTFLPGWGELVEYEEFLASGDPSFPIQWPLDDWETIVLNYTSGTTSRPKGVLYHHRGAYLAPLITVQFWGMQDESVYLWTLPMFHCNGWTFIWGMAAIAGTNVIIRNVEAKAIYDSIVKHKVTHLCGAPVVFNTIANAPPQDKKKLPGRVFTITGGAPPPPSVLSNMESMGFTVLHSYGLTETYGPALVCVWKPEWNGLSAEERARIKARQGVATVGLQGLDVLDPDTMKAVPRDAKTIGEIMIRGHTVMKGYFKDEDATRKAFEGGWYHTGDLGVMHPDGYVEVKDRSKDIIISGGENISSIEVESVLFKHPQIMEAAVVARPDKHWGESPCAFVTLREGAMGVNADTIVAYCREHLPKFYVPKTIVFCELPKTTTGKVQKFKLREMAKALPQSVASKL